MRILRLLQAVAAEKIKQCQIIWKHLKWWENGIRTYDPGILHDTMTGIRDETEENHEYLKQERQKSDEFRTGLT
jgi:hypothetical protein